MPPTPGPAPVDQTAVLASAGLDSIVLLAAEARHARVHPIYVGAGLAWERAEVDALARVLARPPLAGRAAPLARLACPVDDLYPEGHWALTGRAPAFDTPDADVYLPGRNVLLIAKAAVYCAERGIGRLALGPLADNPFPDATPAFFAALGLAVSLGLAHELTVVTPLAGMHKAEVIRLGIDLGVPLAATLSCMSPGDGLHCGRCSKCRERRDGFADAGMADPTEYATPPLR
jgi:7-cyano-7-deazaguanine synthase